MRGFKLIKSWFRPDAPTPVEFVPQPPMEPLCCDCGKSKRGLRCELIVGSTLAICEHCMEARR